MTTRIHREDPALTFIDTAAKDEPQARVSDPQMSDPSVKMKLNLVEVKTKRVQLVMQPSMYKRAKKAAETAGLSFNEYVHRLIDLATQGGK